MVRMPGKLGKFLWETAKKVLKFLFGASEGISRSQPVDEKSAVSDIDSMVEMLEAYKDEIRKMAVDVEEAVSQEMSCYMEELEQFFTDQDGLMWKYGISGKRIHRQIQKVSSSMKGYIGSEADKGISLGNPELRKILKMIPGTEKKEAMDKFAGSVIEDSLDRYCQHIRGMLSELFEEVEEEAMGAIEKAADEAGRYSRDLGGIDEGNLSGKMQSLISEAGYIIEECGIVERIWEG